MQEMQSLRSSMSVSSQHYGNISISILKAVEITTTSCRPTRQSVSQSVSQAVSHGLGQTDHDAAFKLAYKLA